jgi:hypothetical protein
MGTDPIFLIWMMTSQIVTSSTEKPGSDPSQAMKPISRFGVARRALHSSAVTRNIKSAPLTDHRPFAFTVSLDHQWRLEPLLPPQIQNVSGNRANERMNVP